jgi:hypothetical protein
VAWFKRHKIILDLHQGTDSLNPFQHRGVYYVIYFYRPPRCYFISPWGHAEHAAERKYARSSASVSAKNYRRADYLDYFAFGGADAFTVMALPTTSSHASKGAFQSLEGGRTWPDSPVLS